MSNRSALSVGGSVPNALHHPVCPTAVHFLLEAACPTAMHDPVGGNVPSAGCQTVVHFPAGGSMSYCSALFRRETAGPTAVHVVDTTFQP